MDKHQFYKRVGSRKGRNPGLEETYGGTNQHDVLRCVVLEFKIAEGAAKTEFTYIAQSHTVSGRWEI